MAPGIAVNRPAYTWTMCLAHEAQALAKDPPKSLLSPAEAQVYRSLSAEKRRLDWLAGRVAAKRALGTLFPSLTLSDIEVFNAPDGSPFARIPSGPVPSFSISHCAAGGVCAVSEGLWPIGTDFEPVRAHGPAVLAMFMNAAEAVPLDEEPAVWQTRLWTAKEAVLKLLGLGLACDPRDVRWFARTKTLELDGRARRRWIELERPIIVVEHIPFEDCLIAFAHCGGD